MLPDSYGTVTVPKYGNTLKGEIENANLPLVPAKSPVPAST
jgi:hypothetical protein